MIPMQLLAADPGIDFFEKKIRPVLVNHCYECHSAASTEIKGKLRLDSRDAMRKGGETGASVVPRKIDKSLLIEALKYESFEMPPRKKLSDEVIANFVKWIEMGAPDPRDHPPNAEEATEITRKAIFNSRKDWWSLRPLQNAKPPNLAKNNWSELAVDRFVLQKLQKNNLKPASTADASTLVRRLSFVLTGLPPAPEQVHNFVENHSKNSESAIVSLVNQLLGSPHFGERFARHWMDVVRYTDTYGYEWDNPAKGSWEYRDYLIRAFNSDIGFDQLIKEQLAGDLLTQPRINKELKLHESLIGPMFYHMGEHRHGDSLGFNGVHQEMINNKIDAFSKAFLANTVACARCHDHKLDAITQHDYYALAGVFMTPRWTSRVIDAPGKNDATIAQLKKLRQEINQALKPIWKQQAQSFADELVEAMTTEKEAKDSSPNKERHERWQKAFTVKPDKKSSLNEIGYPAARLFSIAEDADIPSAWKSLAAEWKTAHDTRKSQNEKQFQILADFTQPGLPKGWTFEGDGIRHGYVEDGTPLVALQGDTLVERLLPHGYHTNALSSKLPGAIRMPRQQDIPRKIVSVQLAGAEWSGFIKIPDNAFQTENVTFFNQTNSSWFSFADGSLMNGVQRIRVEIVTSNLNPNFPPRTGKATSPGLKLPDNDTGFNKRSWFSATKIVAHDAGGTPADELNRFSTFYTGPTPKNKAEAWRKIGDWLASSVTNWTQGKASSEDVTVMNWLLSQQLLRNSPEPNSTLKKLLDNYRSAEQNISFPRTANSMDERDTVAVNYPLNIRGNVNEPGEKVGRDFLQIFSGQHKVNQSTGSGRLELAQFLVNPKHPLTARVYVNRVWQWVFGTGLVGTPNDFGHLGQQPTHPELLDFLANEFIADGWSTKRLLKRLVLSQTFRQSGTTTARGVELDPENRLLHHYPTRRLEAEAIRDSLLAVSGRLDRQLYGPPINPPRAKEDAAKRLFSGPIDGNGRRSIYTMMSIMDPPKFLVGFNLPDLKLPTGKRDVTNVPTQALILLNDPFVIGQAKHWTLRMIADNNRTIEQRIRGMYLLAFAREPQDKELMRWTQFVRSLGTKKTDAELMEDQTTWQHVAHAFFNMKEFIYYR